MLYFIYSELSVWEQESHYRPPSICVTNNKQNAITDIRLFVWILFNTLGVRRQRTWY